MANATIPTNGLRNRTLKAYIWADGDTAWHVANAAFQAVSGSVFTAFGITTTEVVDSGGNRTGNYSFTVPVGLPAGAYYVEGRDETSVSGAAAEVVSSGDAEWDGTALRGAGNANVAAWAGDAGGIQVDADSYPVVSVLRFSDGSSSYGVDVTGAVNLDRLDAAVSTRATQTSVDTIDDLLDTEVAAILDAVDTEVGFLVTAVAALPTAADNAAAWGSRVVGTDPNDGAVTADMLLSGQYLPDWTMTADGLTFTTKTIAGADAQVKTFSRLSTDVGGVRSAT